MRGLLLSVSVVAWLLVPLRADAVPIPFTMYNTGLAAEGSTDPNWTVSPPGGAAFIPVTGIYPLTVPWLSNASSPPSKWIQPNNGDQTNDPQNAFFTFTTTFDLTGYNAATAAFEFRVSVDNVLNPGSVQLNGNPVAFSFAGFGAFSAWVPVNSGFVPGMNTLTFRVLNQGGVGGNPTGLRVEFRNALAEAVPEPATLALFGAACAAGAIAYRRRRKTT